MMASEQQLLRLRLLHGRVDPVTAAMDARRFFDAVGDAVRKRWLDLELEGYGDLVDSQPLHVVLGVPADERLAAHVAAYRTQRGMAIGKAESEFRHFFVEGLDELVRTSARVARTAGGTSLELEFSGTPAGYPRRGVFGRDVFERIVSGFVSALYLQLGSFAR